MSKIAIFPGSFDPFTLGHKIIVDSGLRIFDKIYVGVGVNNSKPGLLNVDKRVELIRDVYKGNRSVEVMAYDGLTVDFAHSVNADHVLRGMRNSVDFEFERNMIHINQSLSPNLMAVLLFTPPEYVAISSSIVREVFAFGGDVSSFMPEGIKIENYLK